MLLSDAQIRARVDDETLGIHPWDPERLQPASLDVVLDSFIRVPRPNESVRRVLDLATLEPNHTELQEIPESGLDMAPGSFLLGCTRERISLPGDLAARVEGKSSLGRLGLTVHVTAGFIDPGFSGQVTLELVNLGPFVIRLHAGLPIGQLCLIEMSAVPTRLYGHAGNHYQDQLGPVESRYGMK